MTGAYSAISMLKYLYSEHDTGVPGTVTIEVPSILEVQQEGGDGKVYQLLGDKMQGEQWVIHHLLQPGLYIGYIN